MNVTARRLFLTLPAATLTLAISANVRAQMPTPEEQAAVMKDAGTILGDTANPRLKQLIRQRQSLTADNMGLINALKVARDVSRAGSAATRNAAFTYYVVPPMSSIMRRTNQYPVDGALEGSLNLIAAKGKFEPASFQVYPFADTATFELKAGDLKTGDGKVIPAANLDLKVVKVWYQNANAWYSYFGDRTKKLVPELLLNDDALIKVDTATTDNYVRVDYPTGSKYIWVSAPGAIDPGFDHSKEPVADAATLQPVPLTAGEFKQFWVTVEIPTNAAEGIYNGSIAFVADGKPAGAVPVRLRVLPFTLPDPKTYYDLDADFYTMLYCVPGAGGYYAGNGHDRKASDEKQFKRFLNQRKHSVMYPLYLGLWNGYAGYDNVKTGIELAKKAGMKLDPFFEAYSCAANGNAPGDYLAFTRKADIAKTAYEQLLGHHNIYPAGGEEPGYRHFLNVRKTWRYVQANDMKVLCNGGDRRYYAGYNDDLRVGGGFASADEADFMHKVKAKIGNYAGPHTGPENPDYMRRMHGMNLYKKNYDMMYNYGYSEGGMNDSVGFYRPMCLVYYTRDGMIDTLAWEGIREGLDDIRYSTLMLQLAEKAIATKAIDKVYEGKKALQFVALFNEDEGDLNAYRLETINFIVRLADALNK